MVDLWALVSKQRVLSQFHPLGPSIHTACFSALCLSSSPAAKDNFLSSSVPLISRLCRIRSNLRNPQCLRLHSNEFLQWILCNLWYDLIFQNLAGLQCTICWIHIRALAFPNSCFLQNSAGTSHLYYNTNVCFTMALAFPWDLKLRKDGIDSSLSVGLTPRLNLSLWRWYRACIHLKHH